MSDAAAAQGDSALLRGVILRLALVLGLCSFFNTLDRLNISFAALQMNTDLGLSPSAFGAAASVFFWPYMLLEGPSNIALVRIGARRWLTTLVGLWGLVSIGTALVHDPAALTVARLLLGLAEAGFLPAVLYLSGHWLPASHRGRFMGVFAVWSVAASVIGAPLAGTLLGLDHWHGVRGWRWLFVIEGAPSVLLALACWRWLADAPSRATWLSPAQRARLVRLVAAEESDHSVEAHGWAALGLLVREPRMAVLMALFFCINFTVYGLSYWMPLLLRSVGFSVVQIGWLGAMPGALGCVAMVAWTARSDRRGERLWHLALPMVLAGAATWATAFSLSAPLLVVAGLRVAVAATVTAVAVLWILPSLYLPPTARALGIGLVTAAGAASGLAAPRLVGVLSPAPGDIRASLLLLGAPIALASGLVLFLRRLGGGRCRGRRRRVGLGAAGRGATGVRAAVSGARPDLGSGPLSDREWREAARRGHGGVPNDAKGRNMAKHDADVDAIRTLVAGAVELVRAGDFASIAQAYTETGRLLLPGGTVASGEQGLQDAWKGFLGAMPGLEIDYGPVSIDVAEGRDLAVEVGRYALSYDTPEGRLADRGKYVVVWKRDGEAWKIDVDIINSDLAGPVPARAASLASA